MAAQVTNHRSDVTPTVVGTKGVVPTIPMIPFCPAINAWVGGLGKAIHVMLSEAARLTQMPTARR